MKKIIIGLFLFITLACISIQLINVKAEITETVTLTNGAAIRTSSPNGIKFEATVSNSVEGAKYGMIFAQGTVNDLTIETANTYTAEVDEVDENNSYRVTMVNFPIGAYKQNLSVRAYIKVGSEYKYSELVVVRNMYEVATAYKEKYGESTEQHILDILSSHYDITYVIEGEPIPYSSREEVITDLMTDYNAWSGKSYALDGSDLPTGNDNMVGGKFWAAFAVKNREKWGWLEEYLIECANNDSSTGSSTKSYIAQLTEDDYSSYTSSLTNAGYAASYQYRAFIQGTQYRSTNTYWASSDFSKEEYNNGFWTKLENIYSNYESEVYPSYTNAKFYPVEKIGYKLVGLYDNPDYEGDPLTRSSSSVTTVYAKWEKELYTINYSYDQGGIQAVNSQDEFIELFWNEYHKWYCAKKGEIELETLKTNALADWGDLNSTSEYAIHQLNGQDVLDENSDYFVHSNAAWKSWFDVFAEQVWNAHLALGNTDASLWESYVTYYRLYTYLTKGATSSTWKDGRIEAVYQAYLVSPTFDTEYYYGDTVSIPTLVTNESFVFDGWYDQNNNKVESITPDMYGNLTLTAKWIRENQEVVTLSTQDKNVVSSIHPTLVVNSSFVADKYYLINDVEYQYGVTAFATIADALANAKTDDIIYVFAGTYADELNISTSGVSIYGPNYNVNGQSTRYTEAVISNAVTINASNVSINGLQLTGTSTSVTLGAVSNITIANIYSDAYKNHTDSSYPVIIYSESAVNNLVVKNSKFFAELSGTANYRPFYLNGGVVTNVTIENNYIDNCDVTNGVALGIYKIAGVYKIQNNTFNFQSGNNTFYLGYTSNACTEMWIKDNYFTSDQASSPKIATITVFNFTSTTGALNFVGNTVEYATGGNTFNFGESTGEINVKYNYFKDCTFKLTNRGSNTTFEYNYYNPAPTVEPFLTEYNNNSSYTNEQRIKDYNKFLSGDTSDDDSEDEDVIDDPVIDATQTATITFDYNGGVSEELYKSNGTTISTLIANGYNIDFWAYYASSIIISTKANDPTAKFSDRIYIGLNDATGLYEVVGIILNGTASSWPTDADYVITISGEYTGSDNVGLNISNLSNGDVVMFNKALSTASSSNKITFTFFDSTISNDDIEQFITTTSTLPTPIKADSEFLGWYDENGVNYTSASSLVAAGDITVSAKWSFEGELVGSFVDNSWVVSNESIELKASYIESTNRQILWSSNTPSIATVDDTGVVTGVSEGLAEIIAYDEEDPTRAFIFYVTVLQEQPTGIVKLLLDSNNESIYTTEDLIIGIDGQSPTPYYADIVGSVSKILFEDYTVYTDYYVASPSNITTLTGSGTGGVDFITFHYAADMNGTASKGGKNLASLNKTYNTNGTSASWHYGVGNDGIWYCQNTAYGAWHAGSTKTMKWHATGVTTADVGTEVYTTDVTLKSDNYFYIKGVKTSVQNTTDYSYTKFNKMGLGVKLVGDEWYVSDHYYKSSYGYICSTGGNQNSIGIESSVASGSDLWLTWQYSAQLCAKLLMQFNLPLNRLVGHHFFTGKWCPQPMLENNLEIWYEFREMVRQQMDYYANYSGYTLTFASSSSHLDDNGRVNSLPTYSKCVTYTVTYKTGSTSKTITLSTIIPGTIA